MSVYVECRGGLPVLTPKKGRTKKGYYALPYDSSIWVPEGASYYVVRAKQSFPKYEIESAINHGYMRKNINLTCLFMCDVSPNTKVTELLNVSSASRMNIDDYSKSLSVWYMNYDPDDPDLIILNILQS
jgi:hypothetical protein